MKLTLISFLRLISILFYLIIIPNQVFSQASLDSKFEEFQVNNKPITDILNVFSSVYNISIVYDSTVSGNASYKFVDLDARTALESFLEQNSLYLTVDDAEVYIVSRLKVEVNEDNSVDVYAQDIDIEYLIKKISENTKTSIIYDRLPNKTMTLFVTQKPLKVVLEMIGLNLGKEYQMITNKDFYQYINTRNNDIRRNIDIEVDEDTRIYSFRATQATVQNAIQQLFAIEGEEYISFLTKEARIEDVYFKDKTFEQLLSLVLLSVGSSFSIGEDGVYNIFELKNSQLLYSGNEVTKFTIKHLPVETLVESIPREYLLRSQYSIDSNSNSLLFIGNDKEVEAMKKIIDVMDNNDGNNFYRLDISKIPINKVTELLEKQFPNISIQTISSINSMMINADYSQYAEIRKFVDTIESSQFVKLINLRYVKSTHIFEHLPQSITKDELRSTSDPTVVLFSGNVDRYNDIIKEISLMDRPVSQIRYQILVIQYNDTFDFSLGLNLDNSYTTPSSRTGILSSFKNIFSLSFDLLSTLGMVFSAKLDASLGAGRSKIFIDTVLRSLSGEKVAFSSDNTYRYQEAEISGTNNITSNRGVTRELTSGFNIDILGWISGDNYVTMNITTELSKLGLSTTTSNPPPSSEKKLVTNVRSLIGEPVVIGGLYQDEDELNQGGNVILGLSKSKKRTEYRVYVIPTLESLAGNIQTHLDSEDIYKKYIQNE